MDYIVAPGKSFVAKGQLFDAGAPISKDIFNNEETFKKFVAKKYIVEKPAEKSAEKTEKKETKK